MEVLGAIVGFIFSFDSYVFIAVIMALITLIFGGGIKNALRSGVAFGVGIFGVLLLMDSAIEHLTPMVEAISARLGVSLEIIDIGYAAAQNVMFWPGAFIVMFAIIVINIALVALNLTKTLWTDLHNIWHGNFVGLIVYLLTQSTWLGVAAGLFTLLVSMYLSDLHAPVFQEFNGIPGATTISPSGTFTATFSMLVMMVINKIPFLKNIDWSPEAIKDKFGVFGEPMTNGVLLGIILGILSGFTIQQVMGLAIVLAAILALFPRMAALILEGIVPMNNAISKVLKNRFPGRVLHIALDPAILLGHPAVMSTFIIMVPLSLIFAMVIPGIGFIAIASLIALPYWIGGFVPYTKGNILHTIIVASLWVIMSSIMATQLAPLITDGLGQYGFFQDKIAGGASFTCWDECGNVLAWVFLKLHTLFH